MELDQPDFRIGGFSLWVHGRQYPDSPDGWVGNILNGKAIAEARGSSIPVDDALVHVGEIARFCDELEQVHRHLKGTARLQCIETALMVEVTGDGKGHLTATAHLSPEPMLQKHSLIFEFDQTFLAPLLGDLRRVLQRYPLRNG